MLSKRALSVKPSLTLAISARAKQMQDSGIDVVSFGAGQPDFLPPQNVSDAAIAAIKKGNTKYTPSTGTAELKQAIIEKFKKDNNLDYKPSQIVVSCGAKHSLFNIVQAIVEEGTEVVIPAPYWTSYPEFVVYAGGTPVFAETGDDFKVTAQSIKEKLTKKTRLIMLNSPSNPSGAVIERRELVKIAELAVAHKTWVVSDEIYEKVIYGKEHVSIASLSDDVKALAFTVNGMSKSYAIPGWRLGYIGGPEEAMKAISNIQDNSTSNPTSIVQDAAIAALKGPQDFMKAHLEEYRRRRDYIVKALNEIPGFSCNAPDGAFYVFPRAPVADSAKLCSELLEKAHVACVPGSAFGREGYIRLSYATSMENIKKGVERIKKFFEEPLNI